MENISNLNYCNITKRTNIGRNTLANRAVNTVIRYLLKHVYSPLLQDNWHMKNDCTFYKKTQKIVDDIIQECVKNAREDMIAYTGYDAPDLRCFVTNGYRDSVGLERVSFYVECSYEVADNNEGRIKHRNRVTQNLYVGKTTERWKNHENFEKRNNELIENTIEKYPIRLIDEVFTAQDTYDKLEREIAELKQNRRDFANEFGSEYLQ